VCQLERTGNIAQEAGDTEAHVAGVAFESSGKTPSKTD